MALGQLGHPVVISFPTHDPTQAPTQAPGHASFQAGVADLKLVPSVCSPWDKPGPIEMTRLAGLDLERCGLLVRSTMAEPLICSVPSIEAFISARISCVGANTSFANRHQLLESGFVVLEHLDLVDLPRAGFCLSVSSTHVTAIVRAYQWTN